MICNVIITILLVMSTGAKEKHTYATDKATAAEIQRTLPSKQAELNANGIDSATVLDVKEVPPFECGKGQ